MLWPSSVTRPWPPLPRRVPCSSYRLAGADELSLQRGRSPRRSAAAAGGREDLRRATRRRRRCRAARAAAAAEQQSASASAEALPGRRIANGHRAGADGNRTPARRRRRRGGGCSRCGSRDSIARAGRRITAERSGSRRARLSAPTTSTSAPAQARPAWSGVVFQVRAVRATHRASARHRGRTERHHPRAGAASTRDLRDLQQPQVADRQQAARYRRQGGWRPPGVMFLNGPRSAR